MRCVPLVFAAATGSLRPIVIAVGWIFLVVVAIAVALLIVVVWALWIRVDALPQTGSGRHLEVLVDPAPHQITPAGAPSPLREITVAVTALGPGQWIDLEGSLTRYDGTIVADLWPGQTLTATDPAITITRRIDDTQIPALYVVISWKQPTRTGHRPQALRAPAHPTIDYQPLPTTDPADKARVIPIRTYPIDEFRWHRAHHLRYRYQQLTPRWWLPGAGTPAPLGVWTPRPQTTYTPIQTPGLPH